MIRSAVLEDSEQIRQIYNHYILNSTSTFEEEPIGTSQCLFLRYTNPNYIIFYLVTVICSMLYLV